MNHLFEQYLDEARPQLLGFARSLTWVDPEDLVQETLMRAMTTWRGGTFKQFMAWGKQTLKTRLIDRYEYNAVRRNHRAALSMTLPSVTPSAVTEANILHRDIQRAWDAITEEKRQAITLTAFEGLSYREAAVVMGVPLGTPMSRLFR